MEKTIDSKKMISKELKKHLNNIKLGFSFFGLTVKMVDDDKLAFYDEDNNLVAVKNYELNSAFLNNMSNSNEEFNLDDYKATTEFRDTLGRKFYYEKNYDDESRCVRHIFKIFPDRNKTRYVLEMTFGEDDNKIKRIALDSYNPEDEYEIKDLIVSESDFKVKIERSRIDEDTRRLLNTERSFWYATPEYFLWPLFYMTESFDASHNDDCGKNNCHIYYSGIEFSCKGKVEQVAKEQSREEDHNLAFAIASHPRNKELISYTINEFEKVFPGITDLVYNNCKLYRDLTSIYVSNPLADSMVANVTCKKCNFKKNKSLKNIFNTKKEQE